MSNVKLEYFEPAAFWTEALPVGNGRLGAMVWGGFTPDLLQLNECTLWSGGPKDWNNPEAAEYLQQVRDLVWKGDFVGATNLSQSKMLGPDQGQVYQPLGDIVLDFGESHYENIDTNAYQRELDLETAMVHVSYNAMGVEFSREIFASYPDQVVVMRMNASKAASISCKISLRSQLPAFITTDETPHRIIMQGRCPGNISTLLAESQVCNNVGMAFAAVLEVQVQGSNANVRLGISADDDNQNQLVIGSADSVLLLLAASSSFDGPFKDPSTSSKSPLATSLGVLDSIATLPYSTLAARHLQDYQPLFKRVSLDLSRPEANNKCSDADPGVVTAMLSTKDRVKLFVENEDPSLVALLFNFGRYLMLASSRPGSAATNLQGIWSAGLHPAWGCTPHTNINLQMNYWPAEICNLSECHQPLFDLISVLVTNGSTTAMVNYNKRGWVAHHIVDIWGLTAPCSGDPVYALWPMGGAWLCTHLWEHYQFSLDKQFLSEVAFPILKGCAEFLLDWLVEDPTGNYLVTNPATSPEHEFISPDGKLASVSYATTMDMAIIQEVFSAITSAAHVLKNTTDVDMAFLQQVRDASSRLFPPQVGSDGLLMEWALPFQDPDPQHRHMSHLFGIYPGHSLSLQTTPHLCDAAVQSIIKRGEVGPGWSTAWKTALWARLWDANKAYVMVKRMFTLIDDEQTEESLSGGGLYGNLFCAHPPFQIDGNFGITAALAEMLVQSDGKNIYLLPAMGTWADGEVCGLRARGGLTVSKLRWTQGMMEVVHIELSKEAAIDEPMFLHYKNAIAELHDLQPGIVYCFDASLVAKW